MAIDLVKVAAVLDAVADHLDAIESEKVSSLRAQQEGRLDDLAKKYAEAMGEEMPEALRRKLANSDGDVLGLVTSVVAKHASQLDALGSPSDRSDDRTPLTVKEAAEDADRRFLEWITS